jgi:hypothetical protein
MVLCARFNGARVLLGGAVDCAAGSVLVYPFLSVGNVKY